MNWINYFNLLEETYNIKIDSTIRSTIKNHFNEYCNIYIEEDMYEQTQKCQTYRYKKMKNKYKYIN